MTAVRRALVTAALVSFTTLAQAGTPPAGERPATALPTFGIDVEVRKGLRSIVPEGWQIFVHRNLKLPPTISWSAGQPWDETLASFAASHGFSVRIDWTGRAVFLRPTDVARKEDSAPPETARPAAPEPRPQSPSAAAFNQTTLVDVLARIASVHSYRLSYDASDVRLVGPVSVLGADLLEDLRLVHRALGAEYTPVAFQVFHGNRVLRVLDRAPGTAALTVVDEPATAPTTPVPPRDNIASRIVAVTTPPPAAETALPAATAPASTIQASQVSVPEPSSDRAQTANPSPATSAAPPARASTSVSFFAPQGEPLSAAMQKFFEASGWKLLWKAGDVDFIPEHPVSLRGESVADVLRQLRLPRFGLAVDLWTNDRVAVVRAFDPVQDR